MSDESPVQAEDVEVEERPRREQWKSRIVGAGDEDPQQLLANPRNWRIHPGYQQDALEEALDKIGWVQNVIVNKTTGHVVDGHMRVLLAQKREEATVPVTYVELSEDEERLALATLDPIAELAATDDGALKGLLADLEGQLEGQLEEMLGRITKTSSAPPPAAPTQEQVEKVEDRLEHRFEGERGRMQEVTCPECAADFAVCLDELNDRRYATPDAA